ncbi:MAG: FAD-binding oxidoreductase [Limnochordaceae bacterium]|nr:FAD-binding oxidoreductase [Limnochordaceae bacterium]
MRAERAGSGSRAGVQAEQAQAQLQAQAQTPSQAQMQAQLQAQAQTAAQRQMQTQMQTEAQTQKRAQGVRQANDWRVILRNEFGERVSFDRIETALYAHDQASMPTPVQRLFHAMPAAVVQPRTAQEVQRLVDLAYEYGLPLVPRGAGTSGYGGAIPVRGGIVVDFSHMNRVLSVDVERLQATVEPGMIWLNLEQELRRRHGLALRLYPTSAPGSTVGGWVAEDGAGIGSLAYGRMGENVVSVKLVTPTGTQVMSGAELRRYVAGAEGITGLIVEVTLMLRPAEEDVVRGVRLADRRVLVRFLQGLSAAVRDGAKAAAAADLAGAQPGGGLPFWHVSFSTPRFTRANWRAAGRAANADVVPPGYTVLLVSPASQATEADRILSELSEVSEAAELLCPEEAEREWSERFYPMRLKRFGPSLIPAEAVVPVASLDKVLDDIGRLVAQAQGGDVGEVAIEGSFVSPHEVSLLAFLLGDERRLSYTLGYRKSLAVADAARRHGGRVYGVGLYFTAEAEAVLGRERVEGLRRFKAEVDPRDLLNPGKVIAPPHPALRGLMAAARLGGPVAGLIEPLLPVGGVRHPWPAPQTTGGEHSAGGNLAGGMALERAAGGMASEHAGEGREHMAALHDGQGHGRRGIPDHLLDRAYACAQCGYCRDVCTLYSGRGWESASPRGKWYFLREYAEGKLPLTQEMVDTFLLCTTCKRCDAACQLGLPIQSSWDELRGILVQDKKMATFPAFEMMGGSFLRDHNIWTGPKSERDAWLPPDVQPLAEGEIGYWAGCTASYLERDIAKNAVHILKEAGIPFAYLGKDEACCGVPFLVSGKWDVWQGAVRHNIEEVRRRGIKKLVVSCPGCWVALNHYYRQWAPKLGLTWDVEIEHISETASRAIREGKLVFRRPVTVNGAATTPATTRSVGEVPTTPPTAKSVGEAPTMPPAARSLGKAETLSATEPSAETSTTPAATRPVAEEQTLSAAEPLAEAAAQPEGEANAQVETRSPAIRPRILTWHDPCHIGRHGGIYEPPREVLRAIPGVELREMEHNRENGLCCGSVLTRVGEVPVSDRLGGLRVREAEATGADALVTTCPCCEFQLRVAAKSNGSQMPVVDFTSVVAEALGYETDDPTAEVHYMWSVFERAIYQMSLPGMVEMMRELLPAMMDAMPDVMNSVMEALKKTPAGAREAAVAAMRPLLPRMMPRMMPAMMPRMLPMVQKYMEEQLPTMPASMRAALPDILPYVMDRLMPKAMPKLLPIIAPDMVEAMRQHLGLSSTLASGSSMSASSGSSSGSTRRRA